MSGSGCREGVNSCQAFSNKSLSEYLDQTYTSQSVPPPPLHNKLNLPLLLELGSYFLAVLKLNLPSCIQSIATFLFPIWNHLSVTKLYPPSCFQTKTTFLFPNRKHLPVSKLKPPSSFQTESTFLFPNWIHLPVSKLNPPSCFQSKVSTLCPNQSLLFLKTYFHELN